MDNSKAILLIRGETPVIDNKYPLERHPNITLTEDGGAVPYIHIPSFAFAEEDLLLPVENLDDITII